MAKKKVTRSRKSRKTAQHSVRKPTKRRALSSLWR